MFCATGDFVAIIPSTAPPHAIPLPLAPPPIKHPSRRATDKTVMSPSRKLTVRKTVFVLLLYPIYYTKLFFNFQHHLCIEKDMHTPIYPPLPWLLRGIAEGYVYPWGSGRYGVYIL